MAQPLDGIRVVDWTIWQQGPVCTAMLGDMGAEVIKIESRDGGDPGRGILAVSGLDVSERPNFYFEANNRNKKGITLDLSKPEGQQIARELVDKSDVFVQNFRKGVADRLGLGYDDLRKEQAARRASGFADARAGSPAAAAGTATQTRLGAANGSPCTWSKRSASLPRV